MRFALRTAYLILLIQGSLAFAQVNPKLVSSGFTKICSGSLVAFEEFKPDQKGLYLTNGHCSQLNDYLDHYLEPTQVIKDLAHEEWVGLLKNEPGFFGGGQGSIAVLTEKVLLATMHRRDVAVYELKLTYAQIEEFYGLKPLLFKSSRDLAPGTVVEVVSGHWQKVYSCQFARFSRGTVNAGPFQWTEALVVNQCRPATESGASGAPMLLPGTSYVVGIHGASDKGSSESCSLTDACERDINGRDISEPGDAFSHNLDFVFGCRDSAGVFDATVPGCYF